MIKETYYFLHYGPGIQKRKKELGVVEFMKEMAASMEAAGYGELRASLVEGPEGDILEIEEGATFSYSGPRARVAAIEPDAEFRAAAEETARGVRAPIDIRLGAGEKLPFGNATFDAISLARADGRCNVSRNRARRSRGVDWASRRGRLRAASAASEWKVALSSGSGT